MAVCYWGDFVEAAVTRLSWKNDITCFDAMYIRTEAVAVMRKDRKKNQSMLRCDVVMEMLLSFKKSTNLSM